jgi:hypothetical protein
MYVQFEAVGPECEGAIERRHRVFGSKPGTAAMGKDEWTIARNRRMHQKDRIQKTEDRIQKTEYRSRIAHNQGFCRPFWGIPIIFPILPIGLILPIRPY